MEEEKISETEQNSPETTEDTAGKENRPLSNALQEKKESWYAKVPLTLKQMDVIIWVLVAALAVVFVLIALEAAGIYKIG